MEDREQTICKKVKGKKFLVFFFLSEKGGKGEGRGIYFRFLLKKISQSNMILEFL